MRVLTLIGHAKSCRLIEWKVINMQRVFDPSIFWHTIDKYHYMTLFLNKTMSFSQVIKYSAQNLFLSFILLAFFICFSFLLSYLYFCGPGRTLKRIFNVLWVFKNFKPQSPAIPTMLLTSNTCFVRKKIRDQKMKVNDINVLQSPHPHPQPHPQRVDKLCAVSLNGRSMRIPSPTIKIKIIHVHCT